MNSKVLVFSLMMVSFASLAVGSATYAASPTPGDFDSFVLAMSYENDFCASHADKPECAAGAGHFGMALHGLWPNQKDDPRHTYQYCSDVTARDLGSDWCAPALTIAAKMGDSLEASLATVMPGTQSCLYNHEWYAHGTCSGLSVANYFSKARRLASRFIALSHFKALIATSAGSTVSRDDLMSALVKDLGTRAKRAAIFLCRTDAGTRQAYFSEVDLTLNRTQLMDFPKADSFGKSALHQRRDGTRVKDQGTCPVDGIAVTSPR